MTPLGAPALSVCGRKFGPLGESWQLSRHPLTSDIPSSSSAEANLLVICACFPTVRTFIRSVAPKVLSSNNRSSSDKRRGLSGTICLRNPSRPRRNIYQGFDLDPLQTFVTSGNRDGNGFEETAWHEDGFPKNVILQTKTMDITTDREVA